MDFESMILCYFQDGLRKALSRKAKEEAEYIEEIRIRADKPLIIRLRGKEYLLSAEGNFVQEFKDAYFPSLKEIRQAIDSISQHSPYAFEEEIKNGFITVKGGCRIGLAGTAVTEEGKIKTLKHMNALNIRCAHEIKGCADKIMEYVIQNEQPCHTLIISPPGGGKTTLLRDMIRQASNGRKEEYSGMTVGVVDERGELAGMYRGEMQNDLGLRTDVIEGSSKEEGMLMLLRSMAPKIIAVDEIGKNEDIYAIESVVNAGAAIWCTVHGPSIEKVMEKPVLKSLLERRLFDIYILLSARDKPGCINRVYDKTFSVLYEKEGGFL